MGRYEMPCSKKLFQWHGVAMTFYSLLIFGGEHFFNLADCQDDVNINVVFPIIFVENEIWNQPKK